MSMNENRTILERAAGQSAAGQNAVGPSTEGTTPLQLARVAYSS